MKMLKWALLGGAAFAVSATAAQADDLAALKAQLETLQARVSQLESRPAPSVPEGYQLLAIEDGSPNPWMMGHQSADKLRGTNGTVISVLPTADVAPSTQVVVSGQVRTILFYNDPAVGNDGFDVTARGRLVVEGTTDTAVGKVFVHLRIQGGDFFDASANNAVMNEAYGTWEFMPGWTLLAGRIDNTAAIQAGIDWVFNFGGAVPGVSNSGLEQMRLTYSTGPLSIAWAVEDTSDVAGVDIADIPAFAGYIMYNQDGWMGQLTGAYENDDVGADDNWFIGAGADLTFSDMIRWTAAFGIGEGYTRNCILCGIDDEHWGGSAGVILTLQDDLSAEIGGAYQEVDFAGGGDGNAWNATAGLYWTPVDQVTLGWQADYNDFGGDLTGENFTARFATWLRF